MQLKKHFSVGLTFEFQASGGSSEYLSVPYGTTPAGPGAGPGFMGPPPLNAWTHLAITVAVDGNVTGYLNGAAYGSQIQPVVANVTRSQNYVGLSQWGQNNYNFDGYIADLQLIPSVLSPDDVLNLYNGQPCAPAPPPPPQPSPPPSPPPIGMFFSSRMRAPPA